MVGVGQQLMYSQLTIQTEDGLSHCCPILRTSQSWERGVSIGYIAMVFLPSGKKPILTAINYFTMGSIDTVGPLFQTLRLGAVSLSHRVIQAPCTRMRSTKESDGVFVPNELNVEYYAQRASPGGLMLTEATPISRLVCTNASLVTALTNSSGCWVSRCPRYLHALANRRLEEGHRCSTRERRLHILPVMACWSGNSAIFH